MFNNSKHFVPFKNTLDRQQHICEWVSIVLIPFDRTFLQFLFLADKFVAPCRQKDAKKLPKDFHFGKDVLTGEITRQLTTEHCKKIFPDSSKYLYLEKLQLLHNIL